MSRQQITGIERYFAADEFIVSKTDAKGFITYVNDVFLRIADYRVEEVVGKPHNLIRHPWMPRCIFKLLWERIQSGEEIFAYVVNRTKYGDHYWVFAHVTPSYGEDGKILGYHSNRRVPSSTALKVIQPLYKTLREIEDTAENLTQIAAAVEELSTSIQEINRHIHHLNGISQDTQEQSHGAQEMLLELVKSTEEIGEVSELISSIAEQVNLLALNATIETARAGEAGKGFAVVASEVKALANQTAQATSDVDARIKTVSEGVKQTAAKQTVIASKIKEISESCAGIAAAADEQGATANEISSGLQHISQQTQLLKGAVDQMAKGAQSTEEAANHMQDDSGRLSQSNMQLRAGIEQFVANLTQH